VPGLSRFSARARSLLARGSDVGAGPTCPVWVDWSRPVKEPVPMMITQCDIRRRESRVGLAIPLLAVALAMTLNSPGGHYLRTASVSAHGTGPEPGSARLTAITDSTLPDPSQVHQRYMPGICARWPASTWPAARGRMAWTTGSRREGGRTRAGPRRRNAPRRVRRVISSRGSSVPPRRGPGRSAARR
jgi:hypothetical protein